MRELAGDLRAISVALSGVLLAASLTANEAPRPVVFATQDGAAIEADLYGSGSDAVVLAHGAVFDKESWIPLATALNSAGFRVLVLNFRGYGGSKPGTEGPAALHLDVLGAIDFLQEAGAERISLVGASRGANAVARAVETDLGARIGAVVLMAPGRIDHPDRMTAERFVFIVSKNEPGFDRMRGLYDRLLEPKEMKVLDTDAHAQHAFETDQGAKLSRWIVSALQP